VLLPATLSQKHTKLGLSPLALKQPGLKGKSTLLGKGKKANATTVLSTQRTFARAPYPPSELADAKRQRFHHPS
jgi:hypothetical protein